MSVPCKALKPEGHVPVLTCCPSGVTCSLAKALEGIFAVGAGDGVGDGWGVEVNVPVDAAEACGAGALALFPNCTLQALTTELKVIR